MAKLKKGKAISGSYLMNKQYGSQSPNNDWLDNQFRNYYGNEAYIGELFNYQLNQESANKQMAFQDYMSSTAHTREVADLKAAGLNPILSANGGAATGAGAMATSDSTALSAEMQRRLNKQNLAVSKQLAAKDRKLQEKIASMNIANQQYMNKYTTDKSYELGLHQSELSYMASVYGANQSAAAQRYAAGAAAAATRYAAAQSAAAQMYSANQANESAHYSANQQYRTNREGQWNQRMMNNQQIAYNKWKSMYDYTHSTTGWYAPFTNSWNWIQQQYGNK